MAFTRFQATIKLKGHHSNWGGVINKENCSALANHGTTPKGKRLQELQPEIERIEKALRAGQTVETSTAIIRPTE